MLKKTMVMIAKILQKSKEDDLFSLSAQFSYYIVLGIFPFVILVISIFRHYTSYFYYLLNTVESIIPADVHHIALNFINDSALKYNKPYMSASIFALLWSSTSASVGIIRGINKAYDYPAKNNYFFMRIKGIIFTLALMLSIQLIFTSIVIGRQLVIFLQSCSLLTDIIYHIINILRYVLPLIFLFIIFTVAYKYLPYEKVSFRIVFPGAIFSTFGCIIGSAIFSIYTSNKIMYYNNIYGNISGIFIFLIWVYITSLIFLIGAEINAFSSNKISKKL